MNKLFFLLLTGILLLGLSAQAEDTPVVFSREEITIVPAPEPEKKPVVEEAEKTDKSKPDLSKPAAIAKPVKPRVKQTLTVQLRPESFLYQPGMFQINPAQDKNYLLIVADNEKSALRATTIYAPLDVVFISPEGAVTQIAPKLILHDLSGILASTQPVKAFLILGEGEAESLDIRPGDHVEHALFTPKAVIVK